MTPAERARTLAAASMLLGPLGWPWVAFWTAVAVRAEGTPAPVDIPGWRRPPQPPHPIVRR